MPASADNTDYTSVVQGIDWDELYLEKNLGDHLETLRQEWLQEFDVVLIDSRTGVTDFSGITTARLPDVLAFMFTANRQSLYGCSDIVRRAMEARRQMPIDRPALIPLPIPARFEQREEYDRAQEWRKQFAQALTPFFHVWAPLGSDPNKLVDLLTIPYVPRWTFGEELAFLAEPAGSTGTRSPSQAASYACETISALLVQKFAKVDLLISSRDEYVHTARSVAAQRQSPLHKNVFISYPEGDREAFTVAKEIARLVIDIGCTPILEDPSAAKQSAGRLRVDVERSDVALVLFSAIPSSRQNRETEAFLRQNLRSESERAIFPELLKGGEKNFISSRLAAYNAVFLELSSAKRLATQSFAGVARP